MDWKKSLDVIRAYFNDSLIIIYVKFKVYRADVCCITISFSLFYHVPGELAKNPELNGKLSVKLHFANSLFSSFISI